MTFQSALFDELQKLADAREDYKVWRASANKTGKNVANLKAGGVIGGDSVFRLGFAKRFKETGKRTRRVSRNFLNEATETNSVTNPTFDLDRRISNRQPGSFQIRTPRATLSRKFSQFKKLAAAPKNSAEYWANQDAANLSKKQLNPPHRNLGYLGKRPAKPKQLNLPFPSKKPDPELEYMRQRNRLS